MTSNPYKIMIAELLLRRTRASSVVPVYRRFVKRYPTISSLASSSVKEIEQIIHSLGIQSRSVKIKKIAEFLLEKYSGHLPVEREKMVDIFGRQSNYTANAVLCFAYNKKLPIFDVNVKRVFTRVFSFDFGKDSHKKKTSWDIISYSLPDREIKQFNWALLDLGKAVCTIEKPKCSICPLKSICNYALKRS